MTLSFLNICFFIAFLCYALFPGYQLVQVAMEKPEILIIEPKNIEVTLSAKDFQKEILRTIVVTNPVKDIDSQFTINSFNQGIREEENYISYIEYDAKLISRGQDNSFDKEIQNINNSIIRLNSHIIANNYNISIINNKIDKLAYNKTLLELNSLQKLNSTIKRLNFEISKLNAISSKVNSINSFKININYLNNSIAVSEQINQDIFSIINEILGGPAIQTDLSPMNSIFMKIESNRKLEKGENNLILIIYIPYKITNGEYKTELRISKGEELLANVPITLKINNEGPAVQAETKINATNK